jgi:hypothetical protein
MENVMMIRFLTITAVTLSLASVAAHAGKPGWNQVAAELAARAYAAEGIPLTGHVPPRSRRCIHTELRMFTFSNTGGSRAD